MTNIITTDTAIQATAQAIADKERNYAPMTVAQMPTRIGNIVTANELPNADDTVFEGYVPPTWADGSWADIATALQMHYNGDLDIHDYWSVGDTRTVSLSAMAATGVGESHVAQDVELVLMDADHYNITGTSDKAAFVFGLKDMLANETTFEGGYMESSNTTANGWHGCARRTWCNNVFKAALPSELQALLKQVDILAASAGNSTVTTTSSDYIFLPAEKEIFGANTYANVTAETSLTQYAWYATAANRVKKAGVNGSAYRWWERSPRGSYATAFCNVGSDGSADYNGASNTLGLAPCGCI